MVLQIKITKLAFLLCLAMVPQSAWPSDRYHEKRLAKQLSKNIKIGVPVQLPLDNDDFFAIYTDATTPRSRGGVVLLHGLGAHPDWPQMIAPLRRQLPAYGWISLSVHLPPIKDNATKRDYQRLYSSAHKRIRASIAYFEKRGIYNIVLIGHSLGAAMGLTYITSDLGKSSGVIAFVGVSMYDHHQLEDEHLTPIAIKKINIPVFDIFGNLDTGEILESAKLRSSAAKKAGNKNLTQLKMSGADHFFTGLETKLLKRIRIWINKQAPSMEIDVRKSD